MANADPRAFRPSSVVRDDTPTTELGPPGSVVEVARHTMGNIDLDAYSTRQLNKYVGATQIFDRTIQDHTSIAGLHWSAPNQGRLLLSVPGSVKIARALANKCRREYGANRFKQGILWLGSSEVLTSCPWLWDYPVCVPFRRLRPTFYAEELDRFVSVSPASWSVIVYLPPRQSESIYHRSLSAFATACSTVGRVILNSDIDNSSWEEGYRIRCGKPYSMIS